MSTPVSPEQRETEDLLRGALGSRAEDAPPPPTIADLRERAARQPPPRPESGPHRGAVGIRGVLRTRAPVLAAASVALVVGVLVALPGHQAGGDRIGPGPSSAGDASVVLRRVAVVAATTPPVTAPRPDQFVYTRRVGQAIPRHAPLDYLGPPQPSTLELWTAQDPRASGLSIFDGERDVVGPRPPDTGTITYGPSTYAQFAALPTDPVAMRAYLDELTDGRPFRGAESLLTGTLVPPDVASAIYLAVADVPGLTVEPDVVDAAGRPGIGISQTSATGENLELIFSRDRLQLDGYRSMWTRDDDPDGPGTAKRKAGQIVESYAVVQRAVVDTAGERPR